MTLDELRAGATGTRGEEHTWPAPFGKMSITRENAEFLYALVRLTKPAVVLELGTGSGLSARFMAQALHENGRGLLYTVEPMFEHRLQALELLVGEPVEIFEDVSELPPDIEPDLVFVDSGYRHRDDDMTYWLANGAAALIVVHDANRDYAQLRGSGVLIPCTDGMWIGRAS